MIDRSPLRLERSSESLSLEWTPSGVLKGVDMAKGKRLRRSFARGACRASVRGSARVRIRAEPQAEGATTGALARAGFRIAARAGARTASADASAWDEKQASGWASRGRYRDTLAFRPER